MQQIQNCFARAVGNVSKSTPLSFPSSNLHWLKINEHIEYKLLSLNYTVITTTISLPIFTTCSLFNFLTVLAAHLLSSFLNHQSSHWKSQIAHLHMHHLIFGINFQIHFCQPQQSCPDLPWFVIHSSGKLSSKLYSWSWSVSQFQNNQYYCHLHCSFWTWLLYRFYNSDCTVLMVL